MSFGRSLTAWTKNDRTPSERGQGPRNRNFAPGSVKHLFDRVDGAELRPHERLGSAPSYTESSPPNDGVQKSETEPERRKWPQIRSPRWHGRLHG